MPTPGSPPRAMPVLHKPRESLLTKPRELDAKHYRGMYNLVTAGCVVWIVTLMTLEFRRSGYIIDLGLFHFVSNDHWNTLFLFLGMVTLTFSSFVLTYLHAHFFISSSLSAMLFQICQAAMFTVPTKIVIEREMAIVTSTAIVLEQIVLSMKMHSYFVINQQLRREARDSGDLSPRKGGTDVYPNNVTLGNFSYYLVAPTLVYETTYPRNDNIRWPFFFYKAGETFVMLTVLYHLVQKFISPIYADVATKPLLECILRLAVPAMIGWFTIFYTIFEGMLNCIAELTRFADRDFYQDWWNSENLDEFSRKWNKPVHKWLLRHIYVENLDATSPHGKFIATFSTFLFSAVLHEYVFAIVFRIARLWMLSMMMMQIPAIYLMKFVVRRLVPKYMTEFENITFWVFFYFGFPVMQLMYAREYHMLKNDVIPPIL